MNKYTLEQVRDWHRDQGGKASADRHMGLAGMHYDMMAALDAHLAAQAEWPSEEDVEKIAAYLLSPKTQDACFLDRLRAAMQSVRLPVEVVSDDVAKLLRDLRTTYIGEKHPGGDGCDGEFWDRVECMLASCHAPTKD